MNRIDKLFIEKKENILSIYFTAGFPELDATTEIIKHLDKNGVDFIEIGMPFSDPLADGPVIQGSSQIALENGMSIKLLFEQLTEIRTITQIPLILMGYINPVMQYGIESFCEKCNEIGIDGVILPDLPVDLFETEYKSIFEKYNVHNIFLISPQTSEQRIRQIDEAARGFIYMVSSSSTTGVKKGSEQGQIEYFERIEAMNLNNPRMIGFGISDNASFERACKYAKGAIIGSAFVKALQGDGSIEEKVERFVQRIKNRD